MELEEVNWRMVVVMVVAAGGRQAQSERAGEERSLRCLGGWGRLLLYNRPSSGRGSEDNRLAPLSIPLGFHHPWRVASSQVPVGPLPSHHRALPHFSEPPCWASACACAPVSVLKPSPVIQAGPRATLSHDLIRGRGEAGCHRPRPSQAAASPAQPTWTLGLVGNQLGNPAAPLSPLHPSLGLLSFNAHQATQLRAVGWGGSKDGAPIPPWHLDLNHQAQHTTQSGCQVSADHPIL